MPEYITSRYGLVPNNRYGRCKVHYKAMRKCGVKPFYLKGIWREVRDGVLLVVVFGEVGFFFYVLKLLCE